MNYLEPSTLIAGAIAIIVVYSPLLFFYARGSKPSVPNAPGTPADTGRLIGGIFLVLFFCYLATVCIGMMTQYPAAPGSPRLMMAALYVAYIPVALVSLILAMLGWSRDREQAIRFLGFPFLVAAALTGILIVGSGLSGLG